MLKVNNFILYLNKLKNEVLTPEWIILYCSTSYSLANDEDLKHVTRQFQVFPYTWEQNNYIT